MTVDRNTGEVPKAKLEEQMARDAAYFSDASTVLSTRLEQLQQRLQALPAKAEAHVRDGICSLNFGRSRGDWILSIHAHSSSGPVDATSASVELKAAAARLLPQLIRQIAEKLASNRKMLASALQSLDEVDVLLDEVQTEGM